MLLDEFLKPLGISQSDFAVRLRVSFPRLNEIIRGKRGVTPDTALRLGRVLGMPADFWLGLQLDWDLWHALRGDKAAEIAHLEPVTLTTKGAAQSADAADESAAESMVGRPSIGRAHLARRRAQ